MDFEGEETYLIMLPVPDMSLEQAQEDDQVPAVEATNISNEATTENDVTEKPEKGPVSESALSTEAPSNQSLVSGELAEDVMDISGSEEEGDATEHLPGSSTRAGHGAAESDSEEPYEPPSSFGGMEDVSNPVTDSSKQQQPLTNERLQQHDHLEATNDAPLAMDDRAATDVHVAAEEQLHSVPRPGHAQTPLDLSDSDDYEPPEPMASVDLASLTSDTAAAVAEPSFSPADANDTLQANHVSPDALPAVIDQVDVEREASVQSASEQVCDWPPIHCIAASNEFRHGVYTATISMVILYRTRVHCSNSMLIATTRTLSRA